MTVVHAPLAGRVVPLSDVPDPVFAGQIVGAGLAIEPEDGATEVLVVSPVAGRVAKVHPHALAIADETGTGVLVHLGIDTVHLRGEGFTVHRAEGEDVEAGTPVVTFSPAQVRGRGLSAGCPFRIGTRTPAPTSASTQRRSSALEAASSTRAGAAKR